MKVANFLERLIAALEYAGVPFMVTGSFASTYHGAPRTTQDIDLVVALESSDLPKLFAALPDDRYYLSHDAARAATTRRRQFNVIDLETGWKADLIVRKARPFSRAEFERRVRARVVDVETWVASAEDVVVSKLEWSLDSGGSERQRRDVVGVLDRAGDALDLSYIERWVDAMGLEAEWRIVLAARAR